MIKIWTSVLASAFVSSVPVSREQDPRVDTYSMSGELSLICKGCGGRFASALQLDQRTFGAMRMNDHFECCRLCSLAARYSKSDYYFFFAEGANQPQ